MPPVASELDVAGVGAGDTVGAGEIDGAVEIEVLAGEDGGAEGVVFVKGGGVNAFRRTGFCADEVAGGVVVVGGDEDGVVETGADLGDGAAKAGEGDERGSEK